MAGDGNLSKDSFQKRLIETLPQVFDLVISDRRSYYERNPNNQPDPNSVKTIIDAYSNANTRVSGGMSLIPGPWGMVAVIPEISIVIRNQLAMVYDIGVAYGKERVMTRELLAGVFLSATGSGAGTLLVMHGSKVLVRRVQLRTFQKIVAILAGRITQRVIKSAIGKWLPFVGAAVIATWTNVTTRSIGKRAVDILQKDIELTNEIIDVEVVDADLQERPHPEEEAEVPQVEEPNKPFPTPPRGSRKAPPKRPSEKRAKLKTKKVVPNRRVRRQRRPHNHARVDMTFSR